MLKSNDNRNNLTKSKNKTGLSLVELIVVTVVIAIAACVAFPTYKIFQQRSKEKRLKKILTEVRAAISGSKSRNSTNYFEEGFRTVARVKGMEIIASMSENLGWPDYYKARCISAFVARIGKGDGYPKSPDDIWAKTPEAVVSDIKFKTNEDPTEEPSIEYPSFNLTIPLERRFYRAKPIHPFHDWYAEADFKYVPVIDKTASPKASYSYSEWEDNKSDLIGVKDIVSDGIGLALDGSNTNAW